MTPGNSLPSNGTDERGSGPRVVDIAGTGLRRGLAHGESLRAGIAEALDSWRAQIRNTRVRIADEYVRDFLGQTTFLASVERNCPDLVDEIRGIATGSNQPFDEVFAYNLMDEQWFFEPDADVGCSTVAMNLPGTAERGATVLVGQNMDLPLSMDGSQVVLRVAADDESPEQLILSAAGMIGLLGVNAAGVGCCVNSLPGLRRQSTGVPVAFVIREILRRRTVAEAVDFTASVVHASGQHYAIGDPSGFSCLECSADGTVASPPASEVLHTNHPLWSGDSDRKEATREGGFLEGSHRRLRGLHDALTQVRESGDVRPVLSSVDTGICVVPTERSPGITFCSAEFTLTTPPVVRVALGRPDTTPWATLAWTATA